MLQIIRFLKGYLSIKVWGFSTERFINLCGNHNILLWDIVNHGDYYTMCISLKGFYQLKSITRKTGTRVVVTSRYGLPFLTVKMKKRKIFLAGLCGSVLFWIWMSGFIWNVDIQGNLYITDDVFQDFLADSGIKAGIKKKQIDIETLEKSIRNEFDIVTWTSAKIDGTKLIIQIKENDLIQNQAQEEQDTEKAYDIVADRDGIIESIITRSGVPMVIQGAEIKKGDLLVEGCIPIYNEDGTVKRYEYCTADADILLKYSFSVTEEIKEVYTERIYTGNNIKRNYLLVSGEKLSFPIRTEKYEMYDIMENQNQLCFFSGYHLPVYFGTILVREYREEEKSYSKEEIKQKFEEKIQKFMQTLEEKGVQIIEKNVTIKKYKGTWKMKVDFTVMESAGIQRRTEIKSLQTDQGE